VHSYISAAHKTLLEANRLASFDNLWGYRRDWFETPNDDRNGWSGVSKISLQSADRGALGVFLKRQQNYVRRTFLHPFTGESTFTCEFRALQFLLKHGVAVPKPIFFDEKSSQQGLQAVLMTEELVGYRPLDMVIEELLKNPDATRKSMQALILSVAKAVRKLHYARVQHRALYPKHLFINTDNPESPDVVIIDLEKARIKLMPVMRTVQDVSTLDRHLQGLSRTQRLYFFKYYCEVEKLSFWTKLLCKLVLRRSNKVKPASASSPIIAA